MQDVNSSLITIEMPQRNMFEFADPLLPKFKPFPVVWSPVGPVFEEGVLPILLVQSNLSSLSCLNPQLLLSKLQAKAVLNNISSVKSAINDNNQFSFVD